MLGISLVAQTSQTPQINEKTPDDLCLKPSVENPNGQLEVRFLLCSRYSVLGEVKPSFGQMGTRGSISLESCAGPETEVRELPPNNPEGDASLPIPASFEFPNGHLEERTQEFFGESEDSSRDFISF